MVGENNERPDLNGLRILVVEDAFLVAEEINLQLQGYGCEVVGPAPRLDAALPLAREERLDGAVLDVNLGDEPCFPVAEALEQRGIPFVFLTGYDAEAVLPPEYRGRPRLGKPFDGGELARVAAKHFRRG